MFSDDMRLMRNYNKQKQFVPLLVGCLFEIDFPSLHGLLNMVTHRISGQFRALLKVYWQFKICPAINEKFITLA